MRRDRVRSPRARAARGSRPRLASGRRSRPSDCGCLINMNILLIPKRIFYYYEYFAISKLEAPIVAVGSDWGCEYFIIFKYF